MQDSERDTDIKNRLLDSVGEDKGRMIWENSFETCILPYVKYWCSLEVNFMKQAEFTEHTHWEASTSDLLKAIVLKPFLYKGSLGRERPSVAKNLYVDEAFPDYPMHNYFFLLL